MRPSPTTIEQETFANRITTSAISGRGVRIVVAICLTVVFLAIIAFLRSFKVDTAGFDQAGWSLRLYHALRLALGVYAMLICYSVGYRVLELLGRPAYFEDGRTAFIASFFLGASLYGIVFTVLGLLGLISFGTALALTIPIVLFCHRPVRALWPERLEDLTRRLTQDTDAPPMFVFAVAAAAVIAVLAFLITRVVFIPVPDANIWEHYLHYYRLVLASGSTGPNEVWHHFYNSKGGGLVFLVNVLSDVFSVQVVSGCFAVVSGFIILDLLLRYCRSVSWALFGVALLFVDLSGDVSDGAMFRVHGVLFGYTAFVLWGSVRLPETRGREATLLLTSLVVSLLYLGFYLPVATALFPLGFVLILVATGRVRDRRVLSWFLIMAVAVGAGTAADLVTNWLMTGLAELTPVRLFWAIADREKVERVFGTAGVDFFLAVNNDLLQSHRWLKRIEATIRRPLPGEMMSATVAAAALLFAAWARYRRNQQRFAAPKLLRQIGGFIVPLVVFVLVIPSPSIYRMGVISIVLTVLAAVIVWKRVVDLQFGGLAVPLLTLDAGGEPKADRRLVRLWHVATMAVVAFGILSAVMQTEKSLRRQWPIIAAYVTGSASLDATLRAMESRDRSGPGTTIAAMSEFEKLVASRGRILSVAYDPGYAYALPGEGILSEPTYALIRNRRHIFAATADEVVRYLRGRNISHLVVNLRRPLFSAVAFTALFDPSEMGRQLSVAYRDGDFFILTWRQPKADPLPDDLVQLFELKRTGVLHYPFSRRFVDQMLTVEPGVMNQPEGVRDMFSRQLETVVARDVLPSLSDNGARDLFRRLWELSEIDVQRAKLAFPIVEREARERLLKRFMQKVYEWYIAEFGPDFAILAAECDERVPFAMNYPSDAACGSLDPMVRRLLRDK